MESTEFESLSNAAAGVYRQNALYIRMSSAFDLEPEYGDPVPSALAMHVHEYTHYLHNMSTTAGQAYLLTNLFLLRKMVLGCDSQGYFLGPEAMAPEDAEELVGVVRFMRAQLGSSSAGDLARYLELRAWSCGEPKVELDAGVPTVKATFFVNDSDGGACEQTVTIGLSFVTEGIAYEIEREIRRANGDSEDSLDTYTAIYPYLAFRLLVDTWTGRTTTASERILLGVCSLSSPFSGENLARICAAWRIDGGALEDLAEEIQHAAKHQADSVLAKLREQRSGLSHGDVIHAAMGEYLKLVEAGYQLRSGGYVPELQFLGAPLDVNGYKAKLRHMLDCLVIQGKPEGRSELYWHGPGIAAATDDVMQKLGGLQSALHYSQSHVAGDECVPTAALASRHVSCPFVGGCHQERVDGYPSACKTAPWDRFPVAGPGDLLCWYAAGVKALRGRAVPVLNAACAPLKPRQSATETGHFEGDVDLEIQSHTDKH